jgi:pimeloyl-ACP methyl ester carboxylesterase
MAIKDVSVVLAHGGWADGSSWARVITGLAAAGVRASAAPMPLTSLADDIVALNRSIERMPGPVVLAAHAYAGAVIGLVRPERVKALVYVTAFAPDEGEKLTDLFFRAERIRRHQSSRRTALTCSGCKMRPSLRHSHRTHPRKSSPFWQPCRGRCRSVA